MLRDTLKTLLSAWGPSGNEHAVAEAIKALVAPHVDDMHVDALGNLIVQKYGSDENGKRIAFSAHMDHIGFVVTDIDENGFLRVNNVGGINQSISNARHVLFENGTEGVLYCQPAKGETPAMKHLFIDIGAESRTDAEQNVQIGDMAVYAPDCFEIGANRIASPAMDDRCACALLYGLIKGWINGLFKELVSAGGFLIGLGAAYVYYKTVGCSITEFIIITLATPLVLGLLATILTKVLDKVPVAGFINHLLGAILGVVKWGLIAGFILLLLEKLEPLKEYIPNLTSHLDSLKEHVTQLMNLIK